MNILNANFDDLIEKYYLQTSAQTAAKRLLMLIENSRDNELAELLRDYREKAIVAQKEIQFRAATDKLIKCYSALEIGALSNFISLDFKHQFLDQSLIILNNKYVKQYYEQFYPERLPELFRLRLQGITQEKHKYQNNDSTRLMMIFLELDDRFSKKLDDRYFLKMLDSFSFNGIRFDHLVDLIGKPDEFIDHLLNKQKQNTILAEAAIEFSVFMQFCFDLKRLLEDSSSYPVIQSAFWCHYGYWFEIIGSHLKTELGKAIEQFITWTTEDKHSLEIKEIKNYVSSAQAVIQDLTSDQYSYTISTRLSQFRNTIIEAPTKN